MANKKLSELSPLSAAPDGADILAITDTSTTLTKKVTITELMESWATVETTHGTASIKNFGTSANELVSLDSTGKLPAVDGSQLTNISGGGSSSVMGSGNSYAAGLVLDGSATHAGEFLRKDGTWVATLALGATSSTALSGDTTTISSGQASAITANTAKVTFPGFGTSSVTALAGDTSLLALGTSSSTALAGDTTTISSGQASVIASQSGTNTGDEPDASDSVKGIVELATTAETTTGTDTARAVTPAGVQAAVDALVGGAPGALDTLNELAAAIGDDATYASTITNSLALKAPLASPTFTGTIGVPNVADVESAITANTAKVTNVPVATDAIWDTAGDLAVASGTDAASKLGIGTAGQVLTVNSGATAPEWAAASGGGGGVTALTTNAQTGSYTVVSGDLGKLVTFNSSTATTVTVPSGLGAGFYCYVQQIGDGQVNFLGVKNERNQTCLKKDAFGMITSESANEYVLSGDISNFEDCITLVTDKFNSSNYISFDDNGGNAYNASTLAWDTNMTGGSYGKLTGSDLSGNYKHMQTSDLHNALGSALSSSSSNTPSAENNMYGAKNQEGYYDWYVYCGSSNSATSITTSDSYGNSIPCVPVLYQIRSSSKASIPIWAFTVFYDSYSSVYESADSAGSNINYEYATAWIDTPAGSKCYIGGHQDGSSVYGKSGSGTPEGYLYID
tara:strand:+ start:921 stop:2972 length:2052 start_codon:yes stop_codon:yes gene_type:complete